jgi:hypothetical protein
MVATLTAGDDFPRLMITISDTRASANFTPLETSAYHMKVEQEGVLIVDDIPDTVTTSADGKSATLVRAWEPGETDRVGHTWVSVVVNWTTEQEQTFPDEGPLRLDIIRRSGT